MIFNSRPGKIGISINSRSQRHGDEMVPAMDVPFDSVMIPKDELNSFLHDATFWDRHFNERADKMPEPANANVKTLSLTDVYEHSTIALKIGLHEREFILEDAKISKIKLTPCVGGLTELQFSAAVLINDSNTALFEFMSKDCDIEIKLGDPEKKTAKQPELPLNASGAKATEGEAPKRKGRKPANGTVEQTAAP